MDFKTFLEVIGQDRAIINSIIDSPDDGFNYYALADWLEENSNPGAAKVFREIGENPHAVNKLKVGLEHKNNQAFINYLKKEGYLLYSIFPSLNEHSVVTLLRSQGLEITFYHISAGRGVLIAGKLENDEYRGFATAFNPVFTVREINGASNNNINYDHFLAGLISSRINQIIMNYSEFLQTLYN